MALSVSSRWQRRQEHWLLADHEPRQAVRQVKYLNNIVEQDHRGIK